MSAHDLASGLFDVLLHASLVGVVCLWVGWNRAGFDAQPYLLKSTIWGGVFGLLAALSMLQPTEPVPGLRVDIRAAMIGLSALYGGPPAGALTALLALAVRAWIGGPLAATGMIAIGLAFLVAIAGTLSFLRADRGAPVGRLLAFGLALGCAGPAASFFGNDPATAIALVAAGAPPQIIAVMVSTVLFATIIARTAQARRARAELQVRESELEQAERALRESQTLLRTVIDAVPVVINVKDLDGQLVLANEHNAARHGRTVDELLRQPPEEIYDPEFQRDMRARERQVAETGLPTGLYEIQYRDHDGRMSVSLVSKVPLRNSAGAMQYVVTAAMDITERKLADAALRESEGRFRMVADNVPALIWMCNEKAQCTFLNKQWSTYTGRAAEDGLGRGFVESIHPEDRARSLEVERAILAGRGHATEEYRVRGKDGQHRWFLDTMVPRFASDGAYLGHLGVLIDIEERRKLEEQVRRIQRQEAVGQLTAGVAHDFNNLLTVLSGNLNLILEQPGDAAMVTQLADGALQASQRGAELVRRMSAFSRQQTLRPRSIALNRLVTRMSELLRRSLSANIDLELRLSGDLWPCLADSGQVEDSLLNLAINARDAMPAGGRLIIETANVTLDAAYAAIDTDVTPGDYVLLAVSDTGVGMTPEVLARAVQPFYTTKEVGKGSGLGLSMVYGFAKQSGGHLKLYSEVGHGSIVKLYLPRFAGVAEPEPAPPRTALAGGNETILVVEDDELVREYVVGQLGRLRYEVLQARDGPAALTLIDSGRRIDLLFTDVMLPGGLLGPQLLAQARARQPGLRALFTSGYSEASVLPREPGATGLRLLQKPYSPQDLAGQVRAALDAPPAGPALAGS